MNIERLKEEIDINVLHLTSDKKVPLHDHPDQDEVFYCLKGSGFFVRDDGEEQFSVGQSFVARAGAMHSLRTDGELFVASIKIPVVEGASS